MIELVVGTGAKTLLLKQLYIPLSIKSFKVGKLLVMSTWALNNALLLYSQYYIYQKFLNLSFVIYILGCNRLSEKCLFH